MCPDSDHSTVTLEIWPVIVGVILNALSPPSRSLCCVPHSSLFSCHVYIPVQSASPRGGRLDLGTVAEPLLSASWLQVGYMRYSWPTHARIQSRLWVFCKHEYKQEEREKPA